MHTPRLHAPLDEHCVAEGDAHVEAPIGRKLEIEWLLHRCNAVRGVLAREFGADRPEEIESYRARRGRARTPQRDLLKAYNVRLHPGNLVRDQLHATVGIP